MNPFSSAMLTGFWIFTILQKTPQDLADESGHMNIIEFLGGATVLNVSILTVNMR